MKNNRGLIVSILVVSLIAITTARFYIHQQIVKLNNERGVVFVDNTTDTSSKRIKATVHTDMEKNGFIPNSDVAFSVDFEEDVTEEYVKDTFSIEKNLSPNTEIKNEVVKVNSKYYLIKVVDELDEGSLYNVVEKTEEGVNRWAFQTEKKLKVMNFYPSTNLYPNTDPDFTLNFTPVENIGEYVAISPGIPGRWEKQGNYYYFRHPDDNFIVDKKYTITVFHGLHDIYGNEMTEDYSYTFTTEDNRYFYNDDKNKVTNVSALIIQSENAFKYGEEISFDFSILTYFKDKDLSLDISSNEYKVFDLGNRGNYIKNLHADAKEFFNNESYPIINSGKVFNDTQVYKSDDYEQMPKENTVNTGIIKNSDGYFAIAARVNETYDVKFFQVNNIIASANFIDTGEAFMVVKNAPKAKVSIGGHNIGSVDNDGLLYIENVAKEVNDDSTKINYMEIESNDGSVLVLDISENLYRVGYYNLNKENEKRVVTRFNNGYLYNDRPVYRVGETINYWGYARNKVYGVDEAKIIISVRGEDVEEAKLKLNSMGCYTYQYKLDNVDSGTYVSARLVVNGKEMDYRYSRVEDYATRKYIVDVEKEGRVYVAGDTTNVAISANTYDGIPLANTIFTVSQPDKKYRKVNINVKDFVTDIEGNADGEIEFYSVSTPSTTDSEYIEVRIENDMLDGGYEYLDYTVYPYKNDARMMTTYDKETGEYKLSFEEYDVKNNSIAGTDKIKVVARAKTVDRVVSETYYDEYTKREEKRYRTVYNFVPEFDKTIEVTPIDGKASCTIKNWSDGKNEKGYYNIVAYIESDLGQDLRFWESNSEYMVYGYDMWNENKINRTDSVTNVITSNSGDIKVEEQDKRTKQNEIPMYKLLIPGNAPLFGDEIKIGLYSTKDKSEYYDDYYYDDYYDYDYDYEYDNSNYDELQDYTGIEMYAFLISGKGVDILKSKDAPIKFTYDKSMGANIAFYVVTYDGEKAYGAGYIDRFYIYDIDETYINQAKERRSSNEKNIKRSELDLDLSITFDKEKYNPGDEATITVKTTYKGKGVESGVNISAVDTGYLDENGLTYVDIKSSLGNPYSFRLNEVNSHTYNHIEYINSGGGGGGGDGDSDRDKILTTALFENIITDKNGEAQIKVQLPDNITEWTITTQAISKDYTAAKDIQTLVVTKDLYVDVSNKSYYVEDEKFSFNVKALGKDYVGKQANAVVEILDEADQVVESQEMKLTIGKVTSCKVKAGLKEGKYKIKVSGEYDGKKDVIVKPIEVKKTLFTMPYREQLNTQNGDKVVVKGNQAELIAMNSDVAKIIKDLNELQYLKYKYNRNDSKIISNIADDIYNMLASGKNNKTNTQSYSEREILVLMDDSSYDYELALRNLATRRVSFNKYYYVGNDYYNYDINSAFYSPLTRELGDFATLWAKACCSEPILNPIREYKQLILENGFNDFTKEDVLYIALALAEVGDFDGARELYNMIKPEISYENDEKEFELLTILSIKINNSDRKELYDKYVKTYAYVPERLNYIRLYYIQNELDRNFKEGKLIVNVDGLNEEVKIGNVGITIKYLTNSSKYYIFEKSNNVDLWLEDYKDVEVDKYDSKGIITKTYSNSNPRVGDIITVTITIDAKKLYALRGDESYKICDVVPNNLSYIETLYNMNARTYFNDKDGQKLEYRFYNYSNNGIVSDDSGIITYQARVVNDGEQKECGTIIMNDKNEIIDLIKY